MTRWRMGEADERWRGPALWILLAAFSARVAGQLAVVLWAPAWLPAMDQWYSGLLPYRLLLPTQIVLIGVMARLAARVHRQGGRLPARSPHRGQWLTRASYLYAAAMLVRYAAQLVLKPEWRWVGHTIPIAFHLVLATWLYVLAGAYGVRRRAKRHASVWRLAEDTPHSVY
jgi:hypothetical protein